MIEILGNYLGEIIITASAVVFRAIEKSFMKRKAKKEAEKAEADQQNSAQAD